MKKPVMFAAMAASVAIALSAAAPVFADDDDCYVPMSKWQSREAVRSWAESQGWNIRRLKIDDGCYEIKGYDQAGHEIEVKIDPATFAIVEFEYEDDDENYKRNRNRGNNATPVRPVVPPSNGLFTPGSTPEVIVK